MLTLTKHKKDARAMSEKIRTWENALKCVSGIAGFDVKDSM